jgi:hypothetical protein
LAWSMMRSTVVPPPGSPMRMGRTMAQWRRG